MERKVFVDIAKRIDTLLQFPQELTSLEHLDISIKSRSDLLSFMWLCSLVKASPLLNTLSIKLSNLEDDKWASIEDGLVCVSNKNVDLFEVRMLHFLLEIHHLVF